jgi:predicted nucleic acid-binding protein
VLSLLDDDAADSIVRALPASSCPRAVQAEVHDLSRTVAERAPEKSPGTLSIEDGRPVILPRSAEEASAFVQRAERVRQLSERLAVFDPDLASGGEIAEALADPEIHGSAASWLGATLLANQREAALYCDDRYIRAWAYRLGVPSFGTAALLVALKRRGLLTDDTVDACEWRLRRAGGRHLPVTDTELIKRIADDRYRLSDEVNAVLLDPDGWSTDPDRQHERWHQALVAIWRADARLLSPWAAEVVDRVARTTQVRRPVVASLFMGSAVLTDHPDLEYIRALCAAWRKCTLERFSVGDPARAIVEEVGHTAREIAPRMMPYMVLWALTRLPLGEQLRLLDASARAPRLLKLPE